jgi:hypothetical protein
MPRAVVERIEKLERRLEKLETFTPPAPGPGATDTHKVNSNRKP